LLLEVLAERFDQVGPNAQPNNKETQLVVEKNDLDRPLLSLDLDRPTLAAGAGPSHFRATRSRELLIIVENILVILNENRLLVAVALDGCACWARRAGPVASEKKHRVI
jgi:hypothetical protein